MIYNGDWVPISEAEELRLVKVITPPVSDAVGEDTIVESPLRLTVNPRLREREVGIVISIYPDDVNEFYKLKDNVYEPSVLIYVPEEDIVMS